MSVPARAVTLLVAFAAVAAGAVFMAAGLVYPVHLGLRHHVLSAATGGGYGRHGGMGDRQ